MPASAQKRGADQDQCKPCALREGCCDTGRAVLTQDVSSQAPAALPPAPIPHARSPFCLVRRDTTPTIGLSPQPPMFSLQRVHGELKALRNTLPLLGSGGMQLQQAQNVHRKQSYQQGLHSPLAQLGARRRLALHHILGGIVHGQELQGKRRWRRTVSWCTDEQRPQRQRPCRSPWLR